MSHQPTGRMLRIVEQAIALRANGAKWDDVARRLRKTVDTVRGWPREFPEFWAARLAEAHRELDGEVMGEARTFLRLHMRDKDPKTASDCARILLDHARRSRNPLADPAGPAPEPLTDHLEDLSDEDLRAYIQSQLACLAGPPGDAGNPPPVG